MYIGLMAANDRGQNNDTEDAGKEKATTDEGLLRVRERELESLGARREVPKDGQTIVDYPV